MQLGNIGFLFSVPVHASLKPGFLLITPEEKTPDFVGLATCQGPILKSGISASSMPLIFDTHTPPPQLTLTETENVVTHYMDFAFSLSL